MKKSLFYFLIFLCGCNNRDPGNIPPPAKQQNQEKMMRDAILQYPDSLLLKENLIQYFRDSGNYVNAIREVDNDIKKDSTSVRLWNIKAVLHFEDTDTAKAIVAFEKALTLAPDPQSMISLGTLYAQTKNQRALKIADLIISANKLKNEKEALFIKGLYYSYTNEATKAIAYFDKCLAISFTFMDAYREKAIALYDIQKYTEALAVLDKAITLQNNFDEGYYYSGQCLEKLNRIPEAIQSYKNALVYDPEYVEAKEALVRLGVK